MCVCTYTYSIYIHTIHNVYEYICVYVCAHACKRETCVFVCVGLWPTFILKSLCVCPATTRGGVGRRELAEREEILLVLTRGPGLRCG